MNSSLPPLTRCGDCEHYLGTVANVGGRARCALDGDYPGWYWLPTDGCTRPTVAAVHVQAKEEPDEPPAR